MEDLLGIQTDTFDETEDTNLKERISDTPPPAYVPKVEDAMVCILSQSLVHFIIITSFLSLCFSISRSFSLLSRLGTYNLLVVC